jgi:hypothetical protein
LFKSARFADEILGGFLGIVQAAIIFGAVLIILDSFFFAHPEYGPFQTELPFLRAFWGGLDDSATAAFFRTTLIPDTFFLIGFLVPGNLQQLYPRGG